MQLFRSFITDERNLFGVCAALGHDFGFNPLILRLAFGVTLLWNPEVVIGTYLLAGLFVIVSHWLFPAPHSKKATSETLMI